MARLALLVILTSHAVMVAVMAMTPVHLIHHGASLTIVGFTISLHIAGMYALSPLFGGAVDRWGARRIMALGMAVLLVAVALAGVGGSHTGVTLAGLILLGIGWSAGTVAGSSALATSIPQADKPSAQGVADALMGLSGAAAAALSGLALWAVGYSGLAAVAGLLVLPTVLQLARLNVENVPR